MKGPFPRWTSSTLKGDPGRQLAADQLAQEREQAGSVRAADKLGAEGVLAADLGPWPIVGEQWAAWALRMANGQR